MIKSIFMYFLLLSWSVSVNADEAKTGFSLGYGLTTPYGASGLVFSRRLNQKYGGKIITSFNDGVALQADFFILSKRNSYWILGVGGDSFASTIKAGFGTEWYYKKILFYWETGVALPFIDGNKNPDLGKALYYFSPALGARYQF